MKVPWVLRMLILAWMVLIPFKELAQINFVTNNGSITVTAYSGTNGFLVIPSSTNGLPVTGIGPSAFYYRGDLFGVTIPDTVTNIGDNAFSFCTGLTNLTMGNGIINIGSNAFFICPQLTNIDIPASLANIGEGAFYYCQKVNAFNVSANNPAYSSTNGILFNKDQTTLVYYPIGQGGKYVVPDQVINIGAYAFGASWMTNITIPAGLINIGDFAFTHCGELTNITFPSGLKNIGKGAFENTLLTNITIPDSVTNIGADAFLGGYLYDVTIGSSVTSIGNSAFDGCPLTTVSIPPSVTNIGVGAWNRNTAANVDSGNPAYSSVNGILFDKAQTTLLAYYEKIYQFTNYVVPSTVTNIAGAAFVGCEGLTGITMGTNVARIGARAFSGCNPLTNLNIPQSVISIGLNAFEDCEYLSAINVDPANPVYTSVNGVMFTKDLSTLMAYPTAKTGNYLVPASVANINDSAFAWCSGLTNVTIPNGVQRIGNGAFSFCDSLVSVSIPDTITYLGAYAFADSFEITNVLIGKGVTSINDGVFANCTLLRNIIVPNTITNIGNKAFYSCFLTNLSIPDSVTRIGSQAFAQTSFASLTVPSSVDSIGNGAFAACYQLTNIYFEGNAPLVDSSLFDGDYNVTAYYLPGTTGWGSIFGGVPTLPWTLPYPMILNNNDSFGVQDNQFGFTISWATNLLVVIEASTNLTNPAWTPLATNSLTSGTNYFSDPQWANYPGRYYRVRTP